MAFNKLNVVIGANVEALQKELRKVERDLQRFGQKMQRIGTDLTQLVTVPIAGLGAAALKSFSDIERLEKGLIALMGSGEAAAAEMEKLREVAKLPGLGFQEAIDGSVRLQAVGFSADKARETLLAFGKAVAVSGGTREDFGEVIYQLTQMTSKGKILAEDFKVLQSRIPILGQLLQDAFGTRSIEAIRDSGVTSEKFIEAIIKAANESETLKNVTGGLGNAFENFRDSAKIALSTLGKEIARVLDVQGFLTRLADRIANAVTYFNNLSDGTKKFIVVAAGIAAVIGPALLIIGKIASVAQLAVLGFSSLVGGVKNLIAFFALLPARLATAAASVYAFVGSLTAMQALLAGTGIGLALLALAAAYTAIKKAATEATAAQKAVADVQSESIKNTAQEVGEVKRLVDVLKDENTSKEQRIAAINKLKQISPEYFGGLDAEKTKTADLITISEKYTQSLINRAKAQLAASKIAEIDAKLADSQAIAQESQLSSFQLFRAALSGVGNSGNVAATATKLVSKNIAGTVEDLKKQRSELEKVLRAASAGDLVNLGGGIPKTGATGGGSGASKATAADIADLISQRGTLVQTFGEIQTGLQRVLTVEPLFRSLNQLFLEKGGTVDGLKQIESGSTRVATALDSTDRIAQSVISTFGAMKAPIQEQTVLFQNGTDAVEAYKGAIESFNTGLATTLRNGIANFAEGFGELIGNILAGADTAKGFFPFLLNSIATVLSELGKLAIAAGVAVLGIRKALESLNPFAAIAAGVALVALSTFVKARAKKLATPFADGGIVSGATLALVGEYPGARSNPEVIAPLDKLKGLIAGGGDGGYVAEVMLAGADLRIVLSRADRRFGRQTSG